MSLLKNSWFLFALVTLCWAISASFMAGYYWYQYDDLSLKTKGNIISANLGLNYGNGSGVVWFNGTSIKAGATLLELTRLVVAVNYSESLLGASMNEIENVSNSYPKWWMWWSWSSSGWVLGSVASDKYVVSGNETLLWFYQDISIYPPPPPTE